MRTPIPFLVVLISASFGLSSPAAAQCPGWSTRFGTDGLTGTDWNSDASVEALEFYDHGGGPTLYAGGSFRSGSGASVHGVAAWDGTRWSPLAGGLSVGAEVDALHVFDDGLGGGPRLVVAGLFASAGGASASNIASWNGSAWSSLGSGLDGRVLALEVHDDGSGSALYATGQFTLAGGVPARVARWDGVQWSAVGTGLTGVGRALKSFDPGTGARLHAVVGASLVRWTGTAWQTAGTFVGWGFPPGAAVVHELEVFDSGSGPRLYAAGNFTRVDAVGASNFARFNGTSWSSVPGAPGPGFSVTALRTIDLGAGPRLLFNGWGGPTEQSVWAFDGLTSAELPAPLELDGYVACLSAPPAGSPPGSPFYFGGRFTASGTLDVHNVGAASGASVQRLGRADGLDGTVRTMTLHDEGGGPALYAGGNFGWAGDQPATFVARWNGASWTSLAAGPNGPLYALCSHDPGSGRRLYAGGEFFQVGTQAAANIASWNGTSWSPLGSGVSERVEALVSFDDGSGPDLYAGGYFTSPGARIARWDGASWSGLGGMSGPVYALAVFDDGNGPALYAGGLFASPGSNIAKWNGTSWSQVGGGTSGQVRALTVFDDGSGPALYAGGNFSSAGGVSVRNVARWDGTSWSAVGLPPEGGIESLMGFDDLSGTGPRLYAAAAFSGSVVAFDGTTWSLVGGGVTVLAESLAQYVDVETGLPTLFVGGAFVSAGGMSSRHIASWRSCPGDVAEYCFGDGALRACPCGNHSPLGQNSGCLNSTGSGARLSASGSPSLLADDLVLQGSQMPNSTALYFQSVQTAGFGAGTPLGDGLLCASGASIRLATKVNLGGQSQYPASGDLPVSVSGQVTLGAVRTYQIYYRNAASYCTAAPSNLSNGVRVVWGP